MKIENLYFNLKENYVLFYEMKNLNIVQDTGWICNDFTDYGDKNLYNEYKLYSTCTGTGATLCNYFKNEVARGLEMNFLLVIQEVQVIIFL